MKKFLISTLLCLCMVSLTSCTSNADNKIIEKPNDTTLEFWVAQDVSNVDFSEHCQIVGMEGGSQYYGKDYGSISVDDEQVYDHFQCVIYTITAYPDYSDGGEFITQIDITDPQVSVYGITCNSSFDDFDKTFQDLGCTIQDKGWGHVASYGVFTISLLSNSEAAKISVRVEVTNREGIDF